VGGRGARWHVGGGRRADVASGSRWLVPWGAGGYGAREEKDKRRALEKTRISGFHIRGIETFHITI
jgi:hypothetical protein